MYAQLPYKPNDGADDFARMPNNPGALINTNNEALAQYKAAKKRMSKLNNIEELENRLNRLESLLEEILDRIK